MTYTLGSSKPFHAFGTNGAGTLTTQAWSDLWNMDASPRREVFWLVLLRRGVAMLSFEVIWETAGRQNSFTIPFCAAMCFFRMQGGLQKQMTATTDSGARGCQCDPKSWDGQLSGADLEQSNTCQRSLEIRIRDSEGCLVLGCLRRQR